MRVSYRSLLPKSPNSYVPSSRSTGLHDNKRSNNDDIYRRRAKDARVGFQPRL